MKTNKNSTIRDPVTPNFFTSPVPPPPPPILLYIYSIPKRSFYYGFSTACSIPLQLNIEEEYFAVVLNNLLPPRLHPLKNVQYYGQEK